MNMNLGDWIMLNDVKLSPMEKIVGARFLHFAEFELKILPDVLQGRIPRRNIARGFVEFCQGLLLLYSVISSAVMMPISVRFLVSSELMSSI